MSQQNDLTLQQIAQIALGGTSFGNINISLLHTIINIALKKLDCENEKVIIRGVPAENLRKLLQKSGVEPALTLDENNVKAPMKEYKKIIKLEEQVKILENRLEQHLAMQSFRMPGNRKNCHPCLAECEVEEQKNDTISILLKNEYLTNQLKEYISQPLICRMNRSEVKLTKLSKKFLLFKKDCSRAHNRIDKVDELSFDLVSVNKKIKDFNLFSEKTMLKIQYNMNSKFNNCDIIPFKENFKIRIDLITNDVKNVVERDTKLRALLCSVKPLSELRKSDLFENQKSKKSACNCDEGKKEEGSARSSLKSKRWETISLEDFERRPSEKAKVYRAREKIINL